MISWLAGGGGGWGTREAAIPGEWAALVLIMVLGAALGLLVLWFTVLRHERAVRRRASRRPSSTRLDRLPEAGAGGIVALAGIGAAADEKGAEAAADGDGAPELEPEPATAIATTDEEDEEEAASADEVDAAGAAGAANEEQASKQPPANNKRKLTDEILSRVESELAGREAPRWKELAELVHQEYGVTVHPSSIQKAVKRRRLAAAHSHGAPLGTDPASATA